MKPMKIEEVSWDIMKHYVTEQQIAPDFRRTHDYVKVLKLPIFGCYDNKKNVFSIRHYGDIGHTITLTIIKKAVNPDILYEHAFKEIERKFKEIQKKKCFEWFDEENNIVHKEKITHILPLSKPDFRGYEHTLYPKLKKRLAKRVKENEELPLESG